LCAQELQPGRDEGLRFAYARGAGAIVNNFPQEVPPMPTMDSLEDLLKDEIKDIYDAEKQLTRALPKLIKKATADDLKSALSNHLKETGEHVARLEEVFELMQMPVRGKKCDGMQHLIAEGSEMIADCDEDGTRDALIIAAAQKCEHYEICSYGTMRVWANLLNHSDVASIFEDTLEEEKTADLTLTSIAESFVNEEAAEAGGGKDVKRATSGSRRAVAADRKKRR
jgi:ferritin-like metal-binding protein YciE